MPIDAKFICSRIWKYTHTYDHVGKLLKLSTDGTIIGYRHPNEQRWQIRGEALVLLSDRGTETARLLPVEDAFGWPTFQSDLVGNPKAKIRFKLQASPDILKLKKNSIYNITKTIHRIYTEQFVTSKPQVYGDIYEQKYISSPINLIEISDATLRTSYAVIIKEDMIADESLFHFPYFRDHSLTNAGDNQTYWMQKKEPAIEIDVALHAFGGVYENYYHWLHFFIAKMNSGILAAWKGKRPIVILPTFASDAHRASAEEVLRHHGLDALTISGDASIKVKTLLFPHQHGSSGVDPHPSMAEIFSILKGKLFQKGDFSNKIYISRSDTKHRKLINEPEVEAYLRDKGFEIVSFTGKSLSYQISVMASADFIVGPHGAGMTNVAFCKPGARILEFLSPGHMNLCMSRMAAIAGAQYGGLTGEMSPAHGRDTYSISWEKFTSAVDSMLSAPKT